VKEVGRKYPFRPGMTARVDVITEVRKGILTVPLSSVTTRSEDDDKDKDEDEEDDDNDRRDDEEVKEVVFVNVDGKAVQKEVKTGISDFENIEILSGLEEGDQVVSGPFLAVSKRLKDGDDVEEEEEEEEDSDD